MVTFSEEPCYLVKLRASLRNFEMLDVINGPPRDADISLEDENMGNDVRRRVKSWPRTLRLPLKKRLFPCRL